MKNTLIKIIDEDTTYNKSATRWLKVSHVELWKKLLLATSFLPEDAKPKQRVWHILNDVYSRPVCPITGEFTAWCDKQYFGTANRSAKQLLKHKNGDYANGHSIEANAKRKAGNKARVELGRKYRDISTYTPEQLVKSKKTWIEKYGVDNPSKAVSVRRKISDAQVRNGATPRHLRPLRDLYYQAVGYWTKKSWAENFDDINPDRLNRSEFSLDHIYSVQQGFRDNIPAYIIGHWTNLRNVSVATNSSKGMRCDKTQTQLFDDFFARITG